MKCVSKHNDLQILSPKSHKYEYFQLLQVVVRVSETQLQASEICFYKI